MLVTAIIIFCLTCYYFFPWLIELQDKYDGSFHRIRPNLSKNKYFSDIPLGKYSQVRFHKRYIPRELDVIVIGSGMGSLTTAALLSLAGKKVLVLEQHDVAGGTLHTFMEKGVEFETGLHYIGNISKRKPLYDLLTQNRLEWCQMGSHPSVGDSQIELPKIYDEIAIEESKYQFPAGRANLEAYLTNLFPEEEKAILAYFDLVVRVAQRDLFFKIKSTNFTWLNKWIKYLDPLYYQYLHKTALEVVSDLVCSPRLKSILLGQFGDYGIVPSQAPFFLHASIVNHYLEGGWYPKGGSSKLAEEICRTIWESGGAVLVGQKVNSLLMEYNRFGINRQKENVVGVEMKNGYYIYSDKVISGIGVRSTFTYLIPNTRYQKLLQQIPPSVQHIYCFVTLKGSPKELGIPSSNLWVYPEANFEKLMEQYYQNPLDNKMPLFIGSSSAKDESWEDRFPGKSNLVILAPFPKSYLQEWEKQRCGKRHNDYKLIKTELAQKMIREGIQKFYPRALGKILDYKVGTPLTTQHYLGTVEGESYGLLANKKRFLETELLNPKTPISNFYLTGQDVCTLGVTGAMMGGILTANQIMGYGCLIDIILGNNIVEDIFKKYNLRGIR